MECFHTSEFYFRNYKSEFAKWDDAKWKRVFERVCQISKKYGVCAVSIAVLLLKAVVTLALNTALRKNEIRTLRWNQIDFEKRTVTVGRTKTQAGTGRLIPLNQPAFEALAKWAGCLVESRAEDYVFPACEAAGIERKNPDKERVDPAQSIKSWRSAWRAALKRAGLKVRFHDLRHTCITKLTESQASEHTLMAIAGHVSRRMIEHYSHIRIEAKRAALDAIAKTVSDADRAQNWAQSSRVHPFSETVFLGTLAVARVSFLSP